MASKIRRSLKIDEVPTCAFPNLSLPMSVFSSPWLRAVPLIASCLAQGVAFAQPISDAELQRRQAQQQEQAKSRANNAPDVFTPTGPVQRGEIVLPAEQPCFAIREIEWHGAERFEWINGDANLVLNQCVGGKGLRLLQEHLTGKLIERGYVTGRVLIPEQNLASGRLTVQIVPGRIGQVRDQGDAAGDSRMAFPSATGALLNQRDLDQSLENIRRLSGQQAVEFDLLPGANQGDSDIVIKHPPSKRWHGLITLDDSGADSTGKYQLGSVLAIDSPLHLYDLLTITLNNNANVSNDTFGTTSSSINWNMPFGYWLLQMGVNQSHYKQTVAGFSGAIVYSGHSRGAEIGIGYVPYRTAKAKATLLFKLTRKASDSDIDDTEVMVQRRDVAGYEASFNHRQYLGAATVDLGFGFRASLPSRSRVPGLIVGAADWNGHYSIETLNADVSFPFQLAAQNLRYQSSFHAQHAPTRLPSTEFFSIANRYTVRGFDGAATLAAEDGWLVRNDLAWSIGRSGQDLYLALDHGHVGGPSADQLLGRGLTGMALGWRGRIRNISYDLTAGWPLAHPQGFNTEQPTYTASVAAEF
jgi:hemolysin activation/secretion protein